MLGSHHWVSHRLKLIIHGRSHKLVVHIGYIHLIGKLLRLMAIRHLRLLLRHKVIVHRLLHHAGPTESWHLSWNGLVRHGIVVYFKPYLEYFHRIGTRSLAYLTVNPCRSTSHQWCSIQLVFRKWKYGLLQ